MNETFHQFYQLRVELAACRERKKRALYELREAYLTVQRLAQQVRTLAKEQY
jgi:hypothetical protein